MYTQQQKLEEKERISRLKMSVDPISILIEMGFKIAKETHKEIRCACVIHGGDNKSAFRFNRQTNTWVCFTNECHDTYGRDVISLIMAVKRVDFKEALVMLEDMVGDNKISSLEVLDAKRKRNRKNFIRNTGIITRPEIVTEEILNHFKPFRSDLFNKDNFSNETLDYFEVAGGYVDDYGIPRDIVPIRNYEGELVAFSFRDIREDCDTDFKYIATPDFDKDRVLYNLHNAKPYCEELPLILVEGFKSIWRLQSLGLENCVAIMGSKISEGQVALLQSFAFKGIIIMLDNDKAGKQGTESLINWLDKKMPLYPVYITEVDENGKGLDPSDLTPERLIEYISYAC